MKTAALYVHIPFCKTKCTYCSFFSVTAPDPVHDADYIDTFINSLLAEASHAVSIYHIESWYSIYIGGGTPSILPIRAISYLMKELQKLAPLSPDAEITIEANPEDITAQWLNTLYHTGINRLSVGVQSLLTPAVSSVKRRGTPEITRVALDLIAAQWKGIFSVDIIAGLPHESSQSFINGLTQIIQYKPNHISLYALTVEENTPLERTLHSAEKKIWEKTENTIDRLWLLGRDFLQKNDYFQYEVSNFAQNGFESKHNMVYWNMKSYIGIGPAACSTILAEDMPSPEYPAAAAVRFTNTQDIAQWLTKPTQTKECEVISKETLMFEYIMMGLRKREGISTTDFLRRFDSPIEDMLEPVFSAWQEKGLAVRSAVINGNRYVALTESGLLFLNRFLTEL